MQIIIKEENGFMPDTIINVMESKIEVTEDDKKRVLKYDKYESKKIMALIYDMVKSWKPKYEEKKIYDEEVYRISIIGNINKEIYIKNAYPDNWSKFILFKNKLLREDIVVSQEE